MDIPAIQCKSIHKFKDISVNYPQSIHIFIYSVDIFNRLLLSHHISNSNLDIHIYTIYYMCMKYLGQYPTIEQYIDCCKLDCTPHQILDTEIATINNLQFDFTIITPIDYLYKTNVELDYDMYTYLIVLVYCSYDIVMKYGHKDISNECINIVLHNKTSNDDLYTHITKLSMKLSDTYQILSNIVLVDVVDNHIPDEPLYTHKHEEFSEILLENLIYTGTSIGQGANGIVYRLKDKTTNTEYACKKVRIDPSYGIENLHEITFCNTLHHPNIAQTFIVCITEKSVKIIMKKYKHPLKSKKDQAYTKRYMKDILSALVYLHENNITHGDIKPSNLLVDENNTVIISDFGLSRYCNPLDNTKKVCTLWYRPLEIILGEPFDYSIDMWSIGCVLFYLITDVYLFTSTNELDHIINIIRMFGQPQPDSSVYKAYTDTILVNIPNNNPLWNSIRAKYPIISDDEFDLLSRMFDLNANTRITAKEAIEHAYFKS
jgi:tRNA A-37 threonylcarbamoyl transferase component Bud32